MKNLALLYGRGLVFTILAIFLVATIYGLLTFVVSSPAVAVPIMVLGILPFVFGIMTEG